MNKITSESMYQFKFPSEATFSPNGEKIAHVLQYMDKDSNSYKGNLFVVDVKTKASTQMTFTGDVKSFVWEDDSHILFPALRSEGDKKRKAEGEELTVYHRLSLSGGEAATAFTIPLTVGNIQKLQDKLYLLTVNFDNCRPDTTGMTKAEEKEALKEYLNPSYAEFTELPFWADGNGIVNGKRSRLYLYHDEYKLLTPLTAPTFMTTGVHFNQNYLLYRGVDYTNVKGINHGLFLYDLASGDTKTLIPQDTQKLGAAVILADNTIIATISDTEPYGVNQFPHFYTVDINTGKTTLILENDASVGGASVNSDAKYGGGKSYMAVGNRFYFLTTLGNYSYLRFITPTGEESPTLTPDGSLDSFDLYDQNWVGVLMAGQELPELYYNGEKLTHYNDEFSQSHSVIVPEELSIPCKDGYTITGYIMKPFGYVEGTKYPAILNVHGGPRSVYSDVFLHEMQVWANAGYFVFFSNPIGSDGRGNLFGDINGHYGDTDYKELMDFTDYIVDNFQDVDKERLGITGGSYGGFMTNWVVGHTDRFKAGATQRSISNFITYEGVSDIGYFFNEDMLSATVHTDLEKVWEQSPLKYGMNVKTPLLFIQSKEDYRCWYGDSIQFFNLLQRRGIPSKYVLFYGESHGLSRIGKPKNRIKRIDEITNWFDGYLK